MEMLIGFYGVIYWLVKVFIEDEIVKKIVHLVVGSVFLAMMVFMIHQFTFHTMIGLVTVIFIVNEQTVVQFCKTKGGMY